MPNQTLLIALIIYAAGIVVSRSITRNAAKLLTDEEAGNVISPFSIKQLLIFLPILIIILLFVVSWIYFKPWLFMIAFILFLTAILYFIGFQLFTLIRIRRKISNKKYIQQMTIATLIKIAGSVTFIVIFFLKISGIIR